MAMIAFSNHAAVFPFERVQTATHCTFLVVQQVVTPADHRAQRAMPFVGPAPTGQQAQHVVQGGQQARRAQRRAASGGQLDRQRHPVEPGAEFGDERWVRAEVRVDRPGPVLEQGHRVGRR
ncbi:hypothetical protein ACGF5C_05430 [Micromonospora sp. NPDC047620]|uniref:hypothetical protein n=1 Tax=Micromonospora sp. NPDC047620 TaxID=3364251 RepID=UPI003722AD03